jgi:hypothetical protein
MFSATSLLAIWLLATQINQFLDARNSLMAAIPHSEKISILVFAFFRIYSKV